MIELFLLSYLLALVHEACHWGIAKCLGVPVQGVLLRPWGSGLVVPFVSDPKKELIIAAAGPLFHFVLLPFTFSHEGLFFVNLIMLCGNLLPALPLDGGRILKSVFLMIFPARKAYQLMDRITGVTVLFIGIYLLIETLVRKTFPTGIFLMWFFCLSYKNVKKEQTVGLIRRLSAEKEKGKGGRAYLVYKDERALLVCSELFLDRENIYFMADASGIVALLDEKTVLGGLGEWGSSVTFQKIFLKMIENESKIG